MRDYMIVLPRARSGTVACAEGVAEVTEVPRTRLPLLKYLIL